MPQLEDQVFVFTGATCSAALDEWVTEQIRAYPHQEERIRIAALALREFLMSDTAARHKMRMRKDAGPLGTGR